MIQNAMFGRGVVQFSSEAANDISPQSREWSGIFQKERILSIGFEISNHKKDLNSQTENERVRVLSCAGGLDGREL